VQITAIAIVSGSVLDPYNRLVNTSQSDICASTMCQQRWSAPSALFWASILSPVFPLTGLDTIFILAFCRQLAIFVKIAPNAILMAIDIISLELQFAASVVRTKEPMP